MEEQLEQELQRAIAECRQENRVKRRTSLNRLLILIQQLPGIYRVAHQDYPEAYNRTLMWVCKNIDRFEAITESVERSLVIWINGYLKWRIRDLYIADNSYDPQRVYPDAKQDFDSITNIPDPQVSLSLLDTQIARMQAEKSANIGTAIANYIEQDLGKNLISTFVRKQPECNCHCLALRLLLQQPPQKISQIAREFDVNNQTLIPTGNKNVCLSCNKLVSLLPMKITESVNIFLEPQTHNYAKQFASEQANPAKAKQVYLNTLTVYGVHTYLKYLDINSNLADSSCWNKGDRTLFNVADLLLPSVGRLECRYLLPEDIEVNIPLEAREERMGYVIVRLEEDLQQVSLIGFISPKQVNFETEAIAISQLQPLENLFKAVEVQNRINLRQWLADMFTPEWQPVDLILAGRITRSLATANSATTITRGKTIQWQLNSLSAEIILVLQITEQSSRAIDLCLQLYPGGNSNYLPVNLLVEIIDDTNQPCMSARTKDTDDLMQLEFACQQREQFHIAMELGGVSIVEYFSV